MPSSELTIRVRLTEQQIASEFQAALAGRYLDEKFFYWLPDSVRAWVQLCSSTEYRNANRAIQALEAALPWLLKNWKHAGRWCGLGCGEGSKDVVALSKLADAGARLSYVGVDYSQPLLELALGAARPFASEVEGCKLDIFDDSHLSTLRPEGPPCIFATLGNTLGAFGPHDFPRRLRSLMRPQDRALYDGEVFAGESTLRGYDNPQNRRFAWGPLTALGITENDGDLTFEARDRNNGLYEVAKYFVARRPFELRFGGQSFPLREGEKIRMSSSIKYARDAFFECLAAGGFQLEHHAASGDGNFLLAACAPA